MNKGQEKETPKEESDKKLSKILKRFPPGKRFGAPGLEVKK